MKSAVVIVFVLLLTYNQCVQGKGGGGRGGGSRGFGSSGRGKSGSHSGWSWGFGKSSTQWKTPLIKPDQSSFIKKRYGNSFGNRGVGDNTYIRNGYYGGGYGSRGYGGGSFGSTFLMSALFYRLGSHHGGRSWNSDEDRQWRATTQAPYFENKVPGTESILPAAAVVGAATAFGLTSLLPLNVPQGNPLMYCNGMNIDQAQIKFKDLFYFCFRDAILISCPDVVDNLPVDRCKNEMMTFDLNGSDSDFHALNGTLITNIDIVCNSTFPVIEKHLTLNSTTNVLECFPGLYPEKLSSFIPTTTTEAPTTTEKEMSLEAKVHMLMLDLIGLSDVYESSTKPSIVKDDQGLKGNEEPWIPEALTFPPDFVIPEREYPFTLEYQLIEEVDGELKVIETQPVEASVEKEWLKLHFEHGVSLPPNVVKVEKRKEFEKRASTAVETKDNSDDLVFETWYKLKLEELDESLKNDALKLISSLDKDQKNYEDELIKSLKNP